MPLAAMFFDSVLFRYLVEVHLISFFFISDKLVSEMFICIRETGSYVF